MAWGVKNGRLEQRDKTRLTECDCVPVHLPVCACCAALLPGFPVLVHRESIHSVWSLSVNDGPCMCIFLMTTPCLEGKELDFQVLKRVTKVILVVMSICLVNKGDIGSHV